MLLNYLYLVQLLSNSIPKYITVNKYVYEIWTNIKYECVRK